MSLRSGAVDDRKMLMEKALVFLSRQADAPWSKPLQQQVINLLYYDLSHPPTSFLSMNTSPAPTASEPSPRSCAYRTADGSGYNLLSPNLGRARTPYARSVPDTNFTPLKSLPDPGLLFDTLLRRPDADESGKNQIFTPHPGGLSSMFFAFANLIIHSIFNTDHANPIMNAASSYLDLSPLYGSSEQELNGVRNKNGRGRLYEDVFADQRVLVMPPSTCALLIMFSRNHNYIADQLYAINENDKYVDPETLRGKDDTESKEKLESQEEDLFQRARMINCVQFMRVTLGDYVGAILGLTRDGHSWRLDPLAEMRHLDHSVSPKGEGNVCSVEFNLLYRWHATLSSEDTKWTEGVFRGIMGPDVDFNTATPDQFRARVRAAFASRNPDPTTWILEGLTRDSSTQRFPDAKLAEILHNATDSPAGAFGANGIPAVMRVIEIMAIEGARKWGTCSLNQFRKFMGLKPHKTFAAWNPNERISDIDNLELYVGLLAEATKKTQPGAALCSGYTISRAILADIVCLTRGDKFFTVELTPHNLTAWGYNDCQVDPNDGSYGGMISKILFRNLPDYYPKNSAYAYFPLLVPSTLEKELARRGEAARYDWARPPTSQVARGVMCNPTASEVSKTYSISRELPVIIYLLSSLQG
ncbi:heme peroxidase [Flagelloscypha sp. PMI_526]|nr:heme peroxidase [Flagelloscypha sp. PMI_526]